MKLTMYTAAAILAFILAQAGALPSPQAPNAGVAHSQGQHKDQHNGKGQGYDQGQYGDHKWKGMGQGNGKGQHGPMPDENSIDLTPYLEHPDPVIQHLARRAANPIEAPKSHWWQSQSAKGDPLDPVTVGNPNVREIPNWKEVAGWGAGVFRRDADGDDNGQHGGQGEEEGGWQGKHPEGAGGNGASHGNGNGQWQQGKQSHGIGHRPMADEE